MELFSFKCELLCLVVNLYAVRYNLDRKPEIQAATADLVWDCPGLDNLHYCLGNITLCM